VYSYFRDIRVLNPVTRTATGLSAATDFQQPNGIVYVPRRYGMLLMICVFDPASFIFCTAECRPASESESERYSQRECHRARVSEIFSMNEQHLL